MRFLDIQIPSHPDTFTDHPLPSGVILRCYKMWACAYRLWDVSQPVASTATRILYGDCHHMRGAIWTALQSGVMPDAVVW